MSERRNQIDPAPYLKAADAFKVTLQELIKRACRCGAYEVPEFLMRTCQEKANPSPERVAARDKMAAVDTD